MLLTPDQIEQKLKILEESPRCYFVELSGLCEKFENALGESEFKA